ARRAGGQRQRFSLGVGLPARARPARFQPRYPEPDPAQGCQRRAQAQNFLGQSAALLPAPESPGGEKRNPNTRRGRLAEPAVSRSHPSFARHPLRLREGIGFFTQDRMLSRFACVRRLNRAALRVCLRLRAALLRHRAWIRRREENQRRIKSKTTTVIRDARWRKKAKSYPPRPLMGQIQPARFEKDSGAPRRFPALHGSTSTGSRARAAGLKVHSSVPELAITALTLNDTRGNEWRRERDLNPRYPFGVHTLSRRAP